MVKIIECPRDAMQGLAEFIPTDTKVAYIQQLLKVGFHTLDFGSFVSPKAIPQMQDTAEVLSKLDTAVSQTRLLAIIANKKGAEMACAHAHIHDLGFPFSVSETFQKRNTNQSIEEAFEQVKQIQELVLAHNKKLVVYFSMGFGNPYGDIWNTEILAYWASKMEVIGIETIALSDTIGIADSHRIGSVFSSLIQAFPKLIFGAHLHTTPDTWFEKVEAAYEAGCVRFDGAIKGYGGCPMAADVLTGNMPTERIVDYFEQKGINTGIQTQAFEEAQRMALSIFH